MKNNLKNIFKQVKTESFSYGKFLIDNKDKIIKEKRLEAIKKFLETTRNTTDKNVKNT